MATLWMSELFLALTLGATRRSGHRTACHLSMASFCARDVLPMSFAMFRRFTIVALTCLFYILFIICYLGHVLLHLFFFSILLPRLSGSGYEAVVGVQALDNKYLIDLIPRTPLVPANTHS